MNEAYWFDICRWPSCLTSSFDQRANIANSNIDNMYVMKKMTFYLCIYHANTHLWCSVHCTVLVLQVVLTTYFCSDALSED